MNYLPSYCSRLNQLILDIISSVLLLIPIISIFERRVGLCIEVLSDFSLIIHDLTWKMPLVQFEHKP